MGPGDLQKQLYWHLNNSAWESTDLRNRNLDNEKTIHTKSYRVKLYRRRSGKKSIKWITQRKGLEDLITLRRKEKYCEIIRKAARRTWTYSAPETEDVRCLLLNKTTQMNLIGTESSTYGKVKNKYPNT